MNVQTSLLGCYEAIADRTRRMLDAARAADWSTFDRSERECREWMDRVEQLGDPDALLDLPGRRQRMEILSRVLRDDAALRDLLHPCLGKVDRCFVQRSHAAAAR
jgi:flagellar protein FliT